MSEGSWQSRNVRYEHIHKVGQDEFRQFINSGQIQSGQRIGDFMAGYGAVSRELSSLASEQGLELEVVLTDKFLEQLGRSYVEIPNRSDIVLSRILCDVVQIPFADKSFDCIFVKLGIHELPFASQQIAVNEIYRVLKPGGILSIWDLMPTNKEQQRFIQDTTRKKDELAGFKDLVRDRYFFRQDELEHILSGAGFKKTEFCYEMINDMETHKRLDSEFKGDQSKLREWNEFIRARILSKNEIITYKDYGSTITLGFRNCIMRSKK